MTRLPGLTNAGRSAHGYETRRTAALIGSAGIVAAFLAGCEPASDAEGFPVLSGCWSVLDTNYIEAGRTSYYAGTLDWSERNSVLAGEIVWSDPGHPADSVWGRRNGDSLSFSLAEKGFSPGSPLKGVIQTPDRFYASSYSWGSGSRLSASRLVHCPDTNLPTPNPRLLRLRPTQDSIGVLHVDSIGLNAFASYAYFGDSDVVRFSKAYDTLTFTYRSYRDDESGSKSISGSGFSLLTTPQGEKVIYGNVYAYYSDAIIITDSTEYSLNENVVIPGGLPKGKYKLVIRLQVGCFCMPGPSDFYVKEFTLD